jgi:hypothetical protein
VGSSEYQASASRQSLATLTEDCGFWPVQSLPSRTVVSDHASPVTYLVRVVEG